MHKMWSIRSLCLLLLLFKSIFVIAGTDVHWETVFYADTLFQYTTSTSGEPDSNWRNLNFDTDTWKSGKGGIGYGDNDDNTTITTCNALFIRCEFFIHDKTELVRALLSIDYDDSFVAYINGQEIARSAGLSEGFPGYDEISTLNHEAQIPSGGIPENFVIPAGILAQVLVNGNNVLAVEVHNSHVNSSDMSSTTYFSVETKVEISRYLEIPEWLNPPKDFSSNLPIFLINTNGKTIVDEPKVNVHLGVIDNGPGERNYLSDSMNHYNGTIGIELRGNSTQSFPKKPYTFETRLETGENNDVALLGFPEENDWILRASYYDHTFLRNPLAHHMSRLMGNWSSGNKHCELVIDGEYQGLYILLEKIKRTKNRLDLSKLKPEEITGEDITGGYIYEVAGQHDDFGHSRRLRYPDIDDVAPEQLAYIRKYDDDFRRVMEGLSSEDPAKVYNDWIDLLTFVDYMLIQEASRNPDGYGWSCYFHKDKNGKLCAGPVWDFDQSMHNSTYRDGERTYGWSIDYKLWPDPPFYMKMIDEPYFKYQMKKRWEALRQDEFSTENLFHYVDSVAGNLSEATERNFGKWPNLGKLIWRELPGYELLDTYPNQVYSLKAYLKERWEWMDQELDKVSVYTVVHEIQQGNELLMYPNPANDYINVDLSLSSTQAVHLNIYNNLGHLVHQTNAGTLLAGNNHTHIALPAFMPAGVYILQVQIGETAMLTQRFIKTN